MIFADKLKALRAQHSLKQFDLAERAGLTPNKIQRYEQANQMPKGDDALALAQALGVTADYLLDPALPYPPPEEHLSEKVALIRRLEGLIGALLSDQAGADRSAASLDALGDGALPDVVHLPVFKLGAGFDVRFDGAGQPVGEAALDLYFNGLGEGTFFAAELHGSSMRGPGDRGFSLGEIVVFQLVEPDEVASGDYVYVRAGEHGLFRQAFTHGDRVRLRALNPADPEVQVPWSDVEHVGRLVRRIKDY
jgi:transcriptional regulator with XRE-family HTH domain